LFSLSQLPARDQAIWYLAKVLNIETKVIYQSLEMLANHSQETPAYRKFYIPKKSGGKREIRAPIKELKTLLSKIYHEILAAYPLNYHCVGFRPGRSIVNNGNAHLEIHPNCGANWDIKNFFPSTSIDLIRLACEDTIGRNLHREGVAIAVVDEVIEVLAKLTTLRWDKNSLEILPMGSPTSPCLANHVLNDFDIHLYRLLSKVAKRLDTAFCYTRWGDDLSITSPIDLPNEIFGIVPSLLDKFHYKHHPKKFKVMRRGHEPIEVTGLIIGEDHLIISDHTLQKYQLTLRDLLSRNSLTEEQIIHMRGLVGIVKMIYGSGLAPRIATTLAKAKEYRGDEVIDRILFQRGWREFVTSTENGNPLDPQAEITEFQNEQEEYLLEKFNAQEDEWSNFELTLDDEPHNTFGFSGGDSLLREIMKEASKN
jgi:retron-type reverse transcriptase